MKETITNELNEHKDVIKKLETKEIIEKIENISNLLIDCYKNNGKVVIFGNGGSAADAQHFAAEFVNKFKIERKPLPAKALTTDTSIITAIANDYGYDYIFSKQIEAFCNKNDIVIAITTSDASEERNGHSNNITQGILTAKKKGIKTIGLISTRGNKISKIVDISIKVPSESTPRIQEAHKIILHIICNLVEGELFNK